MNVFLMSIECGHCVHIQACWTYEQITECTEAAARKPCPVCGEKVSYDDIRALVLSDEAAAFDSMPWKDALNVPVEAFTAFQGRNAEVPAFRTGTFADALRGKMQGAAGKARRTEYEAVSKAFGPYLAGERAARAASRSDHATAIPLYDQALAVEEKPAGRAALQVSLAFSLVTSGELSRVAPLLRDAVTYTGEHPATQRMIASGTAYQLGHLSNERGDVAGAESAYRLSMEFGDPEWAARAAVNLGVLADKRGRRDEALRLAEYGYEHGKDETKFLAAHNIGWYSEVSGRRDKAWKFYEIALESPESNVVESAKSGLKRLGKR